MYGGRYSLLHKNDITSLTESDHYIVIKLKKKCKIIILDFFITILIITNTRDEYNKTKIAVI